MGLVWMYVTYFIFKNMIFYFLKFLQHDAVDNVQTRYESCCADIRAGFQVILFLLLIEYIILYLLF